MSEYYSTKKNKSQQVKQPATIDGQLEKLRSRGCVIEDEQHAREVLSSVNYYRLAHYFSPFLESRGRYKAGTSFEKVLRIYDFDREFRNIILVALEEIEITMRAYCSNYHALKYGPLGYQNDSTFDRTHNHQAFISKIDRLIDTNRDLTIVSHHTRKYDGDFPLWVIMELFSFGMLTYFYKDMHLVDKKALVAQHFPKTAISTRHLDSWLDCLSDLRNHCAHYNRLYQNKLPTQPKALEPQNYGTDIFSYMQVMKLLHKRREIWNCDIVDMLAEKAKAYSDVVEMKCYDFPDDWVEQLKW